MIRFERLIVRDSPSRAKRETSVAVDRGQENQVGYYDVTIVNLRKIPNGSLFGNGLVGVAVSTGTYRSALPLATQNAKALCWYTIALLICVRSKCLKRECTSITLQLFAKTTKSIENRHRIFQSFE